MSSSADVLVVGGGVIGLTTAYFLAKAGVQVEVVDKGDLGQESSWAGAGILTPGNPQAAQHPLLQLHAQSVSLFPELSAELKERTGIDNGYIQCGGLELLGDAPIADTDEWRSEGVVAELIDADQILHLEPALSAGCTKAYYLPEMAQVRNPRHVQALIASCRALGVTMRSGCPVFRFVASRGRVTAVQSAAGKLAANQFIVATGAWTDSLLAELGWQPGIVPIRGQIALLNPGFPVFRHIILIGSCYLVPRPEGRVLIGSTEEQVGFDKHTTAAALQSLLAMGTSLVPALSQAHLERCWAGLRPASPDGLPFIGPLPDYENVVVAAGHFRSGIQLSPGTAQLVADIVLGRTPTVSPYVFRLDRHQRTAEGD
ncbi:MAG: glycine oxidase ThiO [Gemmatales bacterium]|nr:MAG: glycine oxidase ThiO [Gemmatales bacterium]